MIHADLHFENVLVKKIKPGGYWRYIIGEEQYNVANMGYQAYIIDYGFCNIPNKLQNMYLDDHFSKIKDSNKYKLYDLFLIKMESIKYTNNELGLFFKEYFDYEDYYKYVKSAKTKISKDLSVKDIIKFMFSKNQITDCKNKKWNCYANATKKKAGKLLDVFDMNKKVILPNKFKEFAS